MNAEHRCEFDRWPATPDDHWTCQECGAVWDANDIHTYAESYLPFYRGRFAPGTLSWSRVTREAGQEGHRRAVLFNDVSRAPIANWLHLSDRKALRDYLWDQGWRRDVRPEDVTE